MKKIILAVMLVATSFLLMSCLNEDKKIVSTIEKMSYESLLEDTFDINAKVNIPELVTPKQETVPLLIKLTNIDLEIDGVFNVNNVETAFAQVVITLQIDEISNPYAAPETDDEGNTEEVDPGKWIYDTTIKYTFTYLEGKLYSDFYSNLNFSEDDTATLNDFLGGFIGFMIGMMIPEEFKDTYNLIVDMLVDHKEVMNVGQNKIIFDSIKNMGTQFIDSQLDKIDIETIKNSNFTIEQTKEELLITKGTGITELFDELNFKVKFNKKQFNGLEGSMKLSLTDVNAITASVRVNLNSDKKVVLENTDEYEAVKVFTMITKLLA